jgi:HAD superfamily phosphoserine phosphatase-like hydrolase
MFTSTYKLILFDNDGTLNNYRSTWEYLHRHFGTWDPEASRLDQILMRERTPYDQYARASAALFKGVPKSKFLERLRTIEIRPGAVELIKTLQVAGIKLAVISSGLSLWRDMWLEREGIVFDYYYANNLFFDEKDICTGEIAILVTDNVQGMDKGSWVDKISAIENVPFEHRAFIGDGWGDVPGFKRCGLSIAIDPNMQEVRNAATFVIGSEEILKELDIFEM